MSDWIWLPISMVARSTLCERWFQLRCVDDFDDASDVSIVRGQLAHADVFFDRGYCVERFI
jgi:hypothetical protein